MSAEPAPVDATALLRQRETLREVIEAISSELELRPLLTAIVRHACELIGADDGTIGLYDEAKGVIRTEAVYRMPPSELGAEMPPGVGLAGQVLVDRRPVLLERYGDVELPTQPSLLEHAVLGLPIFWQDRLIGFFGIGAAPPRRFAAHDVETLTLFARHASIAIQNARLFEQARRLAVLEERQRLARDLHDSVTQMLASATMVAQSIAPLLDVDREEALRRVERVRELNRSALGEMRALLRELQPATPPPAVVVASGEFPVPGIVRLRRQGLVRALEAEIEALEAAGVVGHLEVEGYPRALARRVAAAGQRPGATGPAAAGAPVGLAPGEEVARPAPAALVQQGAPTPLLTPEREELLFRILQEALANAVRHGEAARVDVSLRVEAESLALVIRDDGRGFEPRAYLAAGGEARREGGMGLGTMRERTRALAGTFRLESAPGLGTTVEVRVPLMGVLAS
jgi:signal transduction histidine kinase